MERKPLETVEGKRRSFVFYFAETDPTGRFKYTEMAAAWNAGVEWAVAHPEHPLAYLICAWDNRNGLLDRIKEFSRMMVAREGEKLWIIPEGMDRDEVEKLMSL
jgi:hypothetical protein